MTLIDLGFFCIIPEMRLSSLSGLMIFLFPLLGKLRLMTPFLCLCFHKSLLHFLFLIICLLFFFLVPPNIDDSLSSSDVIVRENSNISLRCKATGSPKPVIKWKRDDNSRITISKNHIGKYKRREKQKKKYVVSRRGKGVSKGFVLYPSDHPKRLLKPRRL